VVKKVCVAGLTGRCRKAILIRAGFQEDIFEHDLVRKPGPTFRDHAQYAPILIFTYTGNRITTNSTGKTQIISGMESLAGSA